ncbi:myosin heavy chain-like protein [Arabidopsis thaliana]|uniref:Myosin heavy chain-like protein n=1 Tax=Arabidopsis thaliana TaxID=3702 RepID=F4JZW7_ARATH|nr:myosin heavy chain-like protein [Arabidopsis thaliana]AED93989.1 myosin heavy chain-like protein [Arabidopsis thaliana]|eukprot:NP_680339.1 myosin heavy chain-like protein [Arabidopsis thaliana]
MSTGAIAFRRKVLSKPMTEACEENNVFLATAIDKEDYTWILLVDDGSAEGARSAYAFRPTLHREHRGGRSPRRPSRGNSSPRRDKARARTDCSPRLSPPSRTMGPPPPVATSPSSQWSGEKTDHNTVPQKEGGEHRDTPPRSKVVLVPQTKSLIAMEKEGNVFRCFKTRKDAILPTFDKWRPTIRERYLLHAHHTVRANSKFNNMVEHYEGLLLSWEQEINSWRNKFSSLEADHRSFSDSMNDKHELEEQVDHFKSKLLKSNDELQAQYGRYDDLQTELAGVRDRLFQSESAADAMNN